MRVVDAIWEKKNLGVSCTEIIIEESDGLDSIKLLDEIKSEYIVIKINAANIQFTQAVQKLGYKFIEIQHQCFHDNVKPNLPINIQRLSRLFSTELALEPNYNIIYDGILDGMFSTDRVAIDPRFGIKMAAIRYYNWAKNEIENSSFPYFLKFKDKRIGFFILKSETQFYRGIIGGIFNSTSVPCAGVFLNYLQIIKTIEDQKQGIWLPFSSNNQALYNINILLNATFKKQYYVFTNLE